MSYTINRTGENIAALLDSTEQMQTTKQDKLVAGKSITIDGNVISAESGMTPEERAELASHEARLSNLEAAAQGKLYREEVDSSAAYAKAVPVGALPYAAVTSIGGRCEDVDGVIAVADVSEIKSGLKTITIPESIRNLPGYGESAGSIANTLDFEAKTFTRKANRQNLGTADLHIGDSSSSVTWIYAKTYGMPQTWNQNTVYKNAIVAGYPSVAQADAGNYEKCTYLGYNNFWAIKDTKLVGMTVAKRKTALAGVMLYKPAVTQSVTDVSDDLKGFDTFLPVESGGEIIFENDAKLDVPSSVTYAINVQEAIANE